MKFLCVRCDEAMKLERVEGPEDGSLGAVFACAGCGNRVAMLTNPMETQLVRALDVRMGGRPSPAEPMQFVRNMLASGRDTGPEAAGPDAAQSRCPFSAMVNGAAERAPIAWEAAAEKRLEHIPEFIRPMARQGIERIAAQRGCQRITEDIMDEVRSALGL